MNDVNVSQDSVKKSPTRTPLTKKRKTTKKSSDLVNKMAFNWKIREGLYNHLASQVGNEVTIEKALETFRARLVRNNKMTSEKIIGDVMRKMRDGSTFSNALTRWVPQDEIIIINSGEVSGNLPNALELVVVAQNRLISVNNAIKSAVTSPLIMMTVTYGTLWFIGKYVTPGLQQALPKEKAIGMTHWLYVVSDLANSYWAFLPPIILILFAILIIKSLPKWTGKNRIYAENFFPYSFYRDNQGYKWLMGFSSLLRAGMSDVEILKRQSDLANPWLKERLQAIKQRMDNGNHLQTALLSKGNNGLPPFGFPNPDIVDDISSIADFPDFPEKAVKLATQWAERIEESTLKAAARFGFWMEMVMYSVMAILMVAINEMTTQLASTPGI
ncbi:type II secretion system F family protein [Methylotenera sp.]|uniref:type II secretion system F family protein n=1 Tax=Methylotenera sp. TaxID=2051956 RepID=UPI002EDB089D